jgi:hypothetical protein
MVGTEWRTRPFTFTVGWVLTWTTHCTDILWPRKGGGATTQLRRIGVALAAEPA